MLPGSRSDARTVSGVRKQCPGLNGPVSFRATAGYGGHPPSLFLYLRSDEPGSQRLSLVIRGKCWIDPGTLDPRDPGPQEPQMDSIVTPFDPVPDPAGPCSGPFSV